MGVRARQKKLTKLGFKPDLPDSLEGDRKLNVAERGTETFLVGERRMNRAQVFSLICDELMDGTVQTTSASGTVYSDPPDLVDLCSRPGMPKLSQVASWTRINTEWRVALGEAEKIAAARRVNEAKGIARRAQGSPQAGGSKLAVDTLLWEAAKLDRKYAEKQIIVDESVEASKQQESALVEQLMAAILAQPDLIKTLAPQIKEILPPAAAAEMERIALERLNAEALDVEVIA